MSETIEISPNYSGPSDLVTDVNTALETLSYCLSIDTDECETVNEIFS